MNEETTENDYDKHRYLWQTFRHEIYTPYVSDGMLLHINGEFTIVKLKYSLLSFSIIRCKSRLDADMIVYVLSCISRLLE